MWPRLERITVTSVPAFFRFYSVCSVVVSRCSAQGLFGAYRESAVARRSTAEYTEHTEGNGKNVKNGRYESSCDLKTRNFLS